MRAQGNGEAVPSRTAAQEGNMEVMVVWIVLLILHFAVIAVFCCCERPMADQMPMDMEMEQNVATRRKRGTTTYGPSQTVGGPETSVAPLALADVNPSMRSRSGSVAESSRSGGRGRRSLSDRSYR